MKYDTGPPYPRTNRVSGLWRDCVGRGKTSESGSVNPREIQKLLDIWLPQVVACKKT